MHSIIDILIHNVGGVIFVLGILIFVHELGHFLAAKAVGIAVPRFSIGLGKATPLRFKHKETEYMIAWIPLGGYVKMASQEEQQEMEMLEGGSVEEIFPPDQLFENKPLWARILVISAGVIMNILFAWVVYTSFYAMEGRPVDPETRIGQVEASLLPAGAEALGDLPEDVKIVRMNGKEVTSRHEIDSALLDENTAVVEIEAAGSAPIRVEIDGKNRRARQALARALAPRREAQVGGVIPGTPAASADLQYGDQITAIGEEPVRAWRDLVRIVEQSAGQELAFTIQREEETLTLQITPRAEQVETPDGGTREVGRIGIGPLAQMDSIPIGTLEAVRLGGVVTWRNTTLIVDMFKQLFSGRASMQEVGGPIFIAQISGEVARQGWRELFFFMAMLSVNLAVLNLLPIPVLDGGHLVFLLIEGLRGGRPIPLEWRVRLLWAGLIILMFIMIFVVINDILRPFRS